MVDDAKKQIAGRINSNINTFAAERALMQVGFTEDFIVPLINQPIIYEYVEALTKAQDSTSDERIKNIQGMLY